ncbi:MAG: N-acetylmuramoyl-L-alanine amidase [Candidatus Kapabacteria bacterium]|nr:N-acetylmuramoyl-L-alanine amidase [Candidatus Kapabacteria bacterium]
MIISSHKLCNDDASPLPMTASPNVGGVLKAKYLVMHFTGGSSAASSATWLRNPVSKASAHIVIGRDGAVVQLVPFNKIAWHAGVSSWEGLRGMNAHSIGIELDNAGRVTKRADGKWQNALGVVVPASAVVEGAHKNDGRVSFWHTYSPAQIESARVVAALLVQKYGLVDIIGHDDIAPGRKIDPGPAFPMESFRSLVMGRAESTPERYLTTTTLNIRSGPGVEHPTLTPKPLPKGTALHRIESIGDWFYVDVQNNTDLEGWVNSRYVKRA